MALHKTLFIAVCLTITQTAHAQMGGPPPGVEFDYDAVTTETLIYQFPNKWKPYSNVTDAKTVTMLFPTGQTPKKWKQALQITEFTTTAGVANANQVKDLKVNANKTKCSAHKVMEDAGGPPPGGGAGEGPPEGGMGGPGGDEARPDEPGFENGYSTAMWTEECDSMVMLNKVIVGNDKLYTMNMTWKSEPRDAEMRTRTDYLRSIFVCDPRTGENVCAARDGGPGGPGGGGR